MLTDAGPTQSVDVNRCMLTGPLSLFGTAAFTAPISTDKVSEAFTEENGLSNKTCRGMYKPACDTDHPICFEAF